MNDDFDLNRNVNISAPGRIILGTVVFLGGIFFDFIGYGFTFLTDHSDFPYPISFVLLGLFILLLGLVFNYVGLRLFSITDGDHLLGPKAFFVGKVILIMIGILALYNILLDTGIGSIGSGLLAITCLIAGFLLRYSKGGRSDKRSIPESNYNDINVGQIAKDGEHMRSFETNNGASNQGGNLTISTAGHKTRISYLRRGKTYSPNYTRITFSLDDLPVINFSIQVEGLLGKLCKALNSQDLETGNRRFDEAFIIKCEDEKFMRKLLTEKVQGSLFALLRLSGQLDAGTSNSQLYVGVLSKIDTEARLKSLIENSQNIFNSYCHAAKPHVNT